LHFYDASF